MPGSLNTQIMSVKYYMQFLSKQDLKTIVVDFSSHCNAMCGNCSRNIDGVKVNPNMPLGHMDLDTWKRIVDDSKGIEEIIFNGAYGDPLMNPNLVFALQYARKLKCKIMIHTNGGIGKPNMYRMLAQELRYFPQGAITFSIDGLEDTNHLYRRHVIWKSVMDNAKAFIDAGGLARWRMLVFDHNKHQIEQCEQLSKDMGFKVFDINGGYTFTAMNSIVSEAVENFKATKKEEARTIKYDTEHLDNVKRLEGLIEKGFDKGCINCKWKRKQKIQISHTGEVFPCCYLLSDRYPKNPDSPYSKECNTIKWPNVNTQTLDDILESDILSTPSENRFKICEVTCGEV